MKRHQRIAAGAGAIAAALFAASCTTPPDKYDMADTSGDGGVDQAEFSRYMFEAIYTELDVDRDSKITWAESKAANPDAKESNFRAADRSGDGVVTPEEAKRHFESQGTMEDLFDLMDTDGDKLLSREEADAFKQKLDAETGTDLQKLSRAATSK